MNDRIKELVLVTIPRKYPKFKSIYPFIPAPVKHHKNKDENLNVVFRVVDKIRVFLLTIPESGIKQL